LRFASRQTHTIGKKEVIAVLNCNVYTEHNLSGLMTGKVAVRPFNGTAAAVVATLISGGLPGQQGADASVATTSYKSKVCSEGEDT
jgi:hypothetical protein